MAFHLTRHGSIRSQLRDIVDDELRTAQDAIAARTPNDEAIHEARKSLKKTRAVLRLLRNALDSDYDREVQRIRVAAHALTSLRDADVTLKTVTSLHRHVPSVMTKAVIHQATTTVRRRRRRTRTYAAASLGKARRALERLERSAPNRVEKAASFQAVHDGMVHHYRDARDAMANLLQDSEATRFHLWRKGVKDLWYGLRLFAHLESTARRRAGTLDRLETLLGDDHDLAVLRNLILSEPRRYGDARIQALILGTVTRRQALLRARALALGHRSFAQAPAHFKRSVGKWWHRH